jgi:hypothetical protein
MKVGLELAEEHLPCILEALGIWDKGHACHKQQATSL